MDIKSAENIYYESLYLLQGNDVSKSKIFNFLKSKSELLIISINRVNLPVGEARTVIEHYAHKLKRVGEFIMNDKLIDKGDSTFLLDQLHSAQRYLTNLNKITLGLNKYLIYLNQIISKTDYIAKGESK